MRKQIDSEQVCFPVGCVPPACCPYPVVSGGGCLGGVSQHAMGQTPPPPREQNDRLRLAMSTLQKKYENEIIRYCIRLLWKNLWCLYWVDYSPEGTWQVSLLSHHRSLFIFKQTSGDHMTSLSHYIERQTLLVTVTTLNYNLHWY